MGWNHVMQELENKLYGSLRGTYRPLDNVPFFRVQYPPTEERQALRELKQLCERIRHNGFEASIISLTNIIEEALQELLNCSASELADRLRSVEQDHGREELQTQLSEHLPDQLADVLRSKMADLTADSVAVLTRMGALFPFVRSSALEPKLEGKVRCAIVLAYPGTEIGVLLDAHPVDPHGGYYRGEIISWR